jgi:hypothetical protein
MKTIITFEGKNIEELSRDDLLDVVRVLHETNLEITRELLETSSRQVELMRRQAATRREWRV